jgi:CDP-diglyceride synthetase
VILATITLVLLALLLGTAELGYRVGRSRRGDEQAASQVATWEGALLGLLALLVGFTFAMAVTRFDGRRELILDEANAIQQVARRSDLMDPAVQRQVTELLRSYVAARIRYYDAGISRTRTEASEREASALRVQLWAQVAAVGRATPGSEMVALFVESADELFVMAARRRAALDNHVPVVVYLMLLVVAATAVAATGYSCGLHQRRHRFGMLLLPVLIAAVVVLVVDLDHPRAGLIRAGQGPMLRLQQTL